MSFKSILLSSVIFWMSHISMLAQTVYTVTSTANSGSASLSEAITNANTSAGVDTIKFNISGAGPHSISLTTALPSITETIYIDGSTQSGTVIGDLISGTAHQLQIEIVNGASLNKGIHMANSADASTIRGIAVSGFVQYGIEFDTGTDNIVIEAVVIGTNITGTTANANDIGLMFSESTSSIVRNSLIAGNTTEGIVFRNSSSLNQIYQNLFGVNMSGTAAIGNGDHNLYLRESSFSNTVGGSDFSYRNILSGSKWGVHFWAGDNNVLSYNYVGTDITGTNGIGNSEAGIEICNGNDGTISNNVFGANANCAITLWGGNLRRWDVTNNTIGTDLALTENLGNGAAGICVYSSVSCTKIEGNIITNSYASSSSANISLSGANGAGIWLREYFSETLITKNSIYNNASLGIDISSNGTPDLNDDGDSDGGSNNILNFPVIDTVYFLGPDLCMEGWAPSGATVEFFVADNEAQKFGEGKSFIFSAVEGSGDDADATLSSYGPGTINGVAQGSYTNENRFKFCEAVVSLPVSVSNADSITATSSKTGGSCTEGFTSEFSAKMGFDITAPFDLDWKNFSVESRGDDAFLQWASSREDNLNYFELERSMNGLYFNSIKLIKAEGTTSEGSNYTYSDPNIGALGIPTFYYRLKAVDFDGSFEYSKVVELSVLEENETWINAWPNPAKDILKVKYHTIDLRNSKLIILNGLGQTYHSQTIDNKSGQVDIKIGNWSNGVYYLTLSGESGKQVFKFKVRH